MYNLCMTGNARPPALPTRQKQLAHSRSSCWHMYTHTSEQASLMVQYRTLYQRGQRPTSQLCTATLSTARHIRSALTLMHARIFGIVGGWPCALFLFMWMLFLYY